MAAFGSIIFDIQANTGRLVQDMNGVKRMLDSVSGNVKGMDAAFTQTTGKISGFISAATKIGGIVAIAAAVGQTLRGIVTEAANAGEEMLKLSQVTGTSVESISALKYAAEQSETSFEALTTGLRLLNKNMIAALESGSETAKMFSALKINIKDGKGALKGTENVLMEVADKFRAMGDSVQANTMKSAIAMKLLGRSGAELVPLLNQGSGAIVELMKKARELGITFTSDTAKKMDEFNDKLGELKARALGASRAIAGPLIDSLLNLFNKFGDKGALEDIEKRMEFLQTGINLKMFKGDEMQRAMAELDQLGKKADELKDKLYSHRGPLQEIGFAPDMKAFTDEADKIKKTIEQFEAWKQKISDLNPYLMETAKQLEAISREAEKFISQGMDPADVTAWKQRAEGWILEGKQIEKTTKQLESYVDALDSFYTESDAQKMARLEDEKKRQQDEAKARLDALNLMQDSYNQYQASIAEATLEGVELRLYYEQEWYDNMLQLLWDSTKDYEKFLEKKERLDKIYGERREKAEQTFAQGVAQGAKDYIESVSLTFDQGRNAVMNFAREIEDTLVRMFDDPKDALRNFGQYLLDTLKRIAVQALANPIIVPIAQVMTGAGAAVSGGVSSLFGGSGQGGGGEFGIESITKGITSLATGNFLMQGASNILSTLGPSAWVTAAGEATGFSSFITSVMPVLSEIMPYLAPLLIALPLITSLFDDKDVPTIRARYSGEQWSIRTWNTGLSREEKTQIAAGLNSFQGLLKLFVTSIEGDVSRLEAVWKKSKEFKGEGTIEEIMKSYMKSLDMDWSAFQKDGETFIETISGIVTAVAVIESIDEHDIRSTFNAISLGEESLRDTLLNLDKDIGNLIDGLADKTGLEYRSGLEEISGLIVKRYEVELAYLTKIRSLIESIGEKTGDIKQDMLLDTMTREQKITYWQNQAGSTYSLIQEEKDPVKVASLYDTWLNAITSGWALLTDAEKKVSYAGTMAWVDTVEGLVTGKLGGAVTEAEASFDTLKGSVNEIDWDALTKGASSAATALGSIESVDLGDYVTAVDLGDYVTMPPGQSAMPSYAAGIDYVPKDMMAKLHRGERVVPAYQANQPINVYVYGDAASLVKVSADAGAEKAIRIIRRNPGIIRGMN